jgi:hypothetical protein
LADDLKDSELRSTAQHNIVLGLIDAADLSQAITLAKAAADSVEDPEPRALALAGVARALLADRRPSGATHVLTDALDALLNAARYQRTNIFFGTR